MPLVASDRLIPSVSVIRRSVRSVMLYSPRSTAPMYVRCSPHSYARSSCDQPSLSRTGHSLSFTSDRTLNNQVVLRY